MAKVPCDHKGAHHFHENAPPYCPKCETYLQDGLHQVVLIEEEPGQVDPDDSYCVDIKNRK